MSIIVPLTKDQDYLDSLGSVIRISLPKGHSYELVLVNDFDPEDCLKWLINPRPNYL